MPLKSFDKLEDAPEELRDAAIETKEGKWVVAVDEDVTPLKSTVEAARKEAKEAKRKAKAAEDRLAEIEAEKEASKAGLNSDELAKIRAQAEAKFAPALTENETLKKQLREMKLDGSVKAMLANAGAVDVGDAWAVVHSEFDLTDDGKVILKDDPTADVEKYVKADLRSKKPHLFKGTQASGGGAQGTTQGGGTKQAKPVTQWSSSDISAYITENGQEAYRTLLTEQMREGVKPKAA